MKSIKILLVTPTFDVHTHGPSNFARYIYSASKKESSLNIYVLSQDIKKPDDRLIHFKYQRPLWYRGLGTYHQSICLRNAITNLHKIHNFSCIIFNHGIHSYSLLKARALDIKIAMLINDDEFLNNKCKFDFPIKRKLYHSLFKYQEKKCAQLADKCIVNSTYMYGAIHKNYGVDLSSIYRLHKGILLSDFNYSAGRPFSMRGINILFVKSDYKRGGLDILIDALNMIPEYSFHLSIVGILENDFFKLQSTWVVKPHLLIMNLGRRQRLSVARLMHQHDILCIPSLREGLGVANIEGLATGISVVSSTTGGIPEVLAGGQAGWMAKPGDFLDLAAQLRDCIQSPQKRIDKSTFGLQWVEKHFQAEDMYHNFEKIIVNTIHGQS